MEILKRILDWLSEYRWYVIGGAAGLLVAILLLTAGFFKTLLIILLVGGGAALLGSSRARETVKSWIVSAYRYITKRG
ncbi:MAG: DUF2273 domain-containing protein [Christensenellaceae bacterium]|jgi:uncharacterized membrane protein|nr:DUF2273 domain-containing protein [Christensenellaceae bacterium]